MITHFQSAATTHGKCCQIASSLCPFVEWDDCLSSILRILGNEPLLVVVGMQGGRQRKTRPSELPRAPSRHAPKRFVSSTQATDSPFSVPPPSPHRPTQTLACNGSSVDPTVYQHKTVQTSAAPPLQPCLYFDTSRVTLVPFHTR